ncbi:pumilio homolog 15-like [Diospyros lotus]|uniref:pumilio homolog 15-like n=1 Tax=Diospyros lotus TaxID=55363 RepID=UPI00225BB117|nr:pumilio homolog 15-like [Diospyros lotus]
MERPEDDTFLLELLATSPFPQNQLPSPARYSSSENNLINTLPCLPAAPFPNNTLHANPNTPFGYDLLSMSVLEGEFRRFNLITPSLHSPSSSSSSPSSIGSGRRSPVRQNNSLIGYSLGTGSLSISDDHHYEINAFSRSLRVQSAAMAQNWGNLWQPSFTTGTDNYLHSNGGRRGPVSSMSFNTGTTQSFMYQNRSQSAYGIIGGYQAPVHSNRNRLGPENSFQAMRRSRLEIKLEDCWGKMMYFLANDRRGSKYLEERLGEGKEEEIDMIFTELKGHVRELMVEPFGKQVVRKLFQVSTPEHITQMLLVVFSHKGYLFEICKDSHGSNAMQVLLQRLTTQEQMLIVMRGLLEITEQLCMTLHGHHVIEQCLKSFPDEHKQQLLNVIAHNCVEIAMDKNGCCLLQKCLPAEGEVMDYLMAELTANALTLSANPYGNYVVQHILQLKEPDINANLLARLWGSFVALSTDKYGSNVVEKCLKELEEDQVTQIIEEIIDYPNALAVFQDPHGNYVAQSAYAVSKGALRRKIESLVQSNYPFLHSHPHGKQVLGKVRRGRHERQGNKGSKNIL